jgi:hypothetical protein
LVDIRLERVLVSVLCFAASAARAELPTTVELLAELAYSSDEIARIERGERVTRSPEPSSERELTAAFAFFVPVPPAELASEARKGLISRVDPNTLAFGALEGAPKLAAFAKLTLAPDPDGRAKQYVTAAPGGGLNLSSAEIGRFNALGSGATATAIEQAVRSALLARVEAYRTHGLAGIEPYALAGGKHRSPADELRSASKAEKDLQKHVPAAYEMLLAYPSSKPPGSEEDFRWTSFMAHGVPTLALTHSLAVPEGDAWLLVQRQFYVSTGYNAEQAIAALLPAKAGTVVLYANRTSTDQVTGFGGSAKRSIGSKLLASQLEELFQKASVAAQKGR